MAVPLNINRNRRKFMNNTPMNDRNNGINANNTNIYNTDEKFANAVKTAALKRKKAKQKKFNTAFISAACVLVLSVVIFAVFAVIGNSTSSEVTANTSNPLQDASGTTEENDKVNLENLFKDPTFDFENEEMRGIWIASVININYPSKPGLTDTELKKELDSIVENAKDAGLNSVFFQVRPTTDALYPSEIFPYSKYVSGTQGVAPHNNFDSLAYILEKATACGIDVHAWVNPFRVTMYESDEDELAPNNPAVLHPEYTVKYADGKTYLNPGIPEVRQLVVDGVKELATNYPGLAGIHFDDYFYPYPSGDAEFDDEAYYNLYGAGMSKDDWRRLNVNTLVHDTYYALKGINPNIRFGVSPFGIWANSGSDTPVDGSTSSGLEAYSAMYCDALAWAKGGYVDYLIPQIYWSFGTSSAPFDNIARWWNRELDGTGVDYYIGHAAYKVADYGENEIGIQVEFARNLIAYRGSVYYGYEAFANNSSGLKDKITELNKYPVRYTENTDSETARIMNPVNNSTVASSNVTLVGKSNPALPLTVNGKKLSRTKDGYFSLYETVSPGINVYTLEQNGVKTTHNINYKTVRQGTSSSSSTLSGFVIEDVSPAGEAWYSTGDIIKVKCTAPSGCTVTAKIGGITINLEPTIKPSGNGKYLKEEYVGETSVYPLVNENESASLGTLMITATRGNETVTFNGALVKQMGIHAPVYAEVVKDYTHLKISPSSSFYDDYTPASVGMRDYVKSFVDNYYKLAFGGYVAAEDVKIVSGVYLNENRIFSVKAYVNGTDTSNNKNNFTDVVFECLENAPVNAVASKGKLSITFYNTASTVMPEPIVTANPLIKQITAISDETNKTVTYTVHLKNELNCYGYNVVYENGNIILRMKNPQSLSTIPGKPLTGKTVVIDPGHGGTDIGAPGCGSVNESQLNLYIALYLEEELKALGANVLMTRTSEKQTVSLYERMDFLTAADPDFAISVHQNSIAQSSNAQKIRGYLGLYGTEAGKLLAKTVSSRICSELNRYERPYAYQQLAVARNHRFPSTLCEMCFISNVEEYQWSVTEGNTKRSAQAIAKGVIDYFVAQEEYLEY